jgi:hypothetical protein
MPDEMYRDAIQRQQSLGYSTFSDYVKALIRSDVLQGSSHLREPATRIALPPEQPVNYGQKVAVGASQMDTETQIVGILKGKYGKKKKPPGSPPGKK